MLHSLSSRTSLIIAEGTFGDWENFKILIIQGLHALACWLSSDSLTSLQMHTHSEISQNALLKRPFDQFICWHLRVSQSKCNFLSEVLSKQEVCFVIGSLSFVIQSELLSGTLPGEIRTGKKPGEYLAHLI